jgi:hypothetical protein
VYLQLAFSRNEHRITSPRRSNSVKKRRREKNKLVLVMQTKTDRLTALPLHAAAANGDFPKATAAAEKSLRPHAAGWDPYEVWRTRVKATQDAQAARALRATEGA